MIVAPSIPDRILLHGLVFHGYHGVYASEQVLGQKFVVDLTLTVDCRQAGADDSLTSTLDYGSVYELVRGIVEAKWEKPNSSNHDLSQGPASPHILLEALATSLCHAITTSFPQCQAVQCTVKKPHVAFTGVLDYVGVDIYRHRSYFVDKKTLFR